MNTFNCLALIRSTPISFQNCKRRIGVVVLNTTLLAFLTGCFESSSNQPVENGQAQAANIGFADLVKRVRARNMRGGFGEGHPRHGLRQSSPESARVV